MIKYGLKLWTSNERALFEEAADLCRGGEADFIELYHHPDATPDWPKLSLLKETLVTIHNPHSHGWHEFDLADQRLTIWRKTLELADFFGSKYIIVHPGQARDFSHFNENLKKIDDSRILIENMAGLDIYGKNVYARTLAALKQIRQLKEICFDLEKAVKAATHQNLGYQKFIADCLRELNPFYFHLSGGNKNSPIDEHKNLWEANFDLAWIKRQLQGLAAAKDIFLVFEVPKNDQDLANDLANINHFRNLRGLD